jgi:hypothetical protein
MLAKVPDGKVWQNWTGDVVNKDSTDATNLTNVLQDSTVFMNYRDRTLNEKTKKAFEDLGNYMAVGLKKAVGLAAVALQAFLEGAPPLSITSLVGGVASLANLIARQFTGSDAFDAAKYTSYVAQTMDLLASPFTCTAAWAAHDNTPESSNALETPGALAGLYAKERVITASKQRDALANLESVEGSRTFTAVPTSGGGFVLVPGAAASLPPDASGLTKLSTNVGDAVDSAKVKFAKFKVKKVGMAKMGGRAGALIDLGLNIADMVKSGPGVGWEATAKDAWTGGGDVFTDCMDKAMPDYLPITHLDGSERTYTPDDDGF